MEQEPMSQSIPITAEFSARNHAGERRPDMPLLRLRDQVIEALPAGVVVLSGDGIVRDCNSTAHNMLGTPLIDRPWAEVLARAFPPPTAPSSLNAGMVMLSDGRRVAVATRALTSPSGQIVLLFEMPVVYETNPELVAAVLAHQIRTPLAAAMLQAGQLMRTELEATQRQRIAGKLRAALGHLERLVNDILVCVRAARLEKRSVALDALLKELIELVGPVAAQHACSIDGPREIPPHAVLAHRDSLLVALESLVVNALEASGPGGRVEISVRTPGEDVVELVVSDDGLGVPQEAAGRLFEPFFTTRARGTGLGLVLVRAVARAHGGEARYAPRAEGGAQFTLRIPIYRPAARDAQVNAAGLSCPRADAIYPRNVAYP